MVKIFVSCKINHPLARGEGPSQWALKIHRAPDRCESSAPLEKGSTSVQLFANKSSAESPLGILIKKKKKC